jgi:hypothetical protein
MIKNYSYSMVALMPVGDRAAHQFLVDLTDDTLTDAHYEGDTFITLYSWLDEAQYKRLYVMVMNKEPPLAGCFITFKAVSNWVETQEEHVASMVKHFKTVHPDKY